jgi:hypothetical protein
MLIKSADDKVQQLALLEELQKSPTPDKRHKKCLAKLADIQSDDQAKYTRAATPRRSARAAFAKFSDTTANT